MSAMALPPANAANAGATWSAGLQADAAAPRTTLAGGQAVFESATLRVAVGSDRQIAIDNQTTGERYRIGADGKLETDGEPAFQFWGNTRFEFDDGTRLTIASARAALPLLTITHGGYGVQIGFAASDSTAALTIDEQPEGGAALDARWTETNALLENSAGAGFVALGADGQWHAVDQNHIDDTDSVRLRQFARAMQRLWFRFTLALVRITLHGTLASLAPPLAPPRDDGPPPPKPKPRLHALHWAQEEALVFAAERAATVVEQRPVLHAALLPPAA
jgi:Domain of Unknown Function (DUF1521)